MLHYPWRTPLPPRSIVKAPHLSGIIQEENERGTYRDPLYRVTKLFEYPNSAAHNKTYFWYSSLYSFDEKNFLFKIGPRGSKDMTDIYFKPALYTYSPEASHGRGAHPSNTRGCRLSARGLSHDFIQDIYIHGSVFCTAPAGG